jgi:hypothetical protein
MRGKILAAAIAAALLPLSFSSFAQTSAEERSRAGSTRCDSLAGTARDQCVREEFAKIEGSAAARGADAPVPGTGIGAGSIPSASNAGIVSRCDALSGTQKSDCVRDEGTATSGAGSADRAGPGSTGMGR